MRSGKKIIRHESKHKSFVTLIFVQNKSPLRVYEDLIGGGGGVALTVDGHQGEISYMSSI